MYKISFRGNLTQCLFAGDKTDTPALLVGERKIGRGEVLDAIQAWSDWLQDQNVLPGERVGVLAENGFFFVAAYFGIIHAGCCAVPLPTDCTENALKRMVASTNMRHFFISSQCEKRFSSCLDQLDVTLISQTAQPTLLGCCNTNPVEVDLQRDLAAIMFTSGSTGDPKGVMVTHQNILSNTQDILSYTGIDATDRVMTVLPFSYCYGMSLLHTHLMAGASLVINNRFMFAEKVLDEMAQTNCTGFAGVPATYQILLRKTRFAKRNFPALRWLQQAGGKLPNALINEIRHAFPEVKFFTMYGQTEATARLSYLPPDRLVDKLGSVGKGLPHARLDVLRPDGSPVALGTGEIGEIVASGESISSGYWADDEETKKYFHDGKLYTGDMATVDADGFIFIVERARDFIKSMGHRVSPKEIEEVLAEMPEIVEAAVAGLPDDLCGEAVKAFVVAVDTAKLTADDVVRYCLNRLPNYKIPQYVEFLPQLPKTSNGKVDKIALRSRDTATPLHSSQ